MKKRPPEDGQYTVRSSALIIHDICNRKLLDYLGHVYFYPLSDVAKKQDYTAVAVSVAEASQDIIYEDGIQAYLFFGGRGIPNPNRGLYLASRNFGLLKAITVSSLALNDPVVVDEALIQRVGSDSMLHILVKLILRDQKCPGVVHTFGNPLRRMGKSGSRGCSVAEFVPEFRPQKGCGNGDSRFKLSIRLRGETYIPIKNYGDITDGKFYLVGDSVSDKCYLLSPSQARRRMAEKGWSVMHKIDGRKSPRNWVFGDYWEYADDDIIALSKKKDSHTEVDRLTTLSMETGKWEERLRAAGCSIAPVCWSVKKVRIPCDMTGFKKNIRHKLGTGNVKDWSHLFVLPFIPILKDGVLPVIDLRTDRIPETQELVNALGQSTVEKGKALNLYSDFHGNLGMSPSVEILETPETLERNGHKAALAIIHDKDFYAKNKLEDPYGSLRYPHAKQHATVEEIQGCMKYQKAAMWCILPVILQELAIKQMLSRENPWRRYIAEHLWEYLENVYMCAPGHPGKNYRRWCLHFPKENAEVALSPDESIGLGCWHNKYINNEFLWSWEQGDPNHHYAFIRKDDAVVMIRVGGVEEHIIYDQALFSMSHKDRLKVVRPLLSGVHRSEFERGMLYVTGGVYGFDGRHGAKRHPSSFYAWVLNGSVSQASQLIEPLLCPNSTRLGSYPARPFLLRIARALYDLFEDKNGKSLKDRKK